MIVSDKGYLSSGKRFLAYVFSFCRLWLSSNCNWKGGTNLSEFLCGNHRNVFSNYRRSKEFSLKNTIFRVDKKQLPLVFSRINCDAAENTIFWKRAKFPAEKVFWPSFLILSSDTNIGEQFLITHNVFYPFFCHI